jgi:ferredoxin-NADP reductase
MVTPTFTVQCLRKVLVAPNVYEVVLSKPKGFMFKAGQFVLLRVPLISDISDIQPRAYSIASINEENDLLFIVKTKEGGRFSEWLTQKIEAGSTIDLQGPFGFFTLRDNDHHCIFVATGAGIAPFRAHLIQAMRNGDQRTMDLFFGVRSEADLFWVDHFEKLASSNANIRLHLCLSGASDSWKGNRGRVQTFVSSTLQDPLKTSLYICGAPEMVNDIKKTAIETWGIPKANVHGEGYI